ncbi:MAG: GNAT family N-acetyltransferase [Deltaproteobacteria bacterium]|nr:GNAT family N-acetyltransferase [Deltaproteobacteria bacterium]
MLAVRPHSDADDAAWDELVLATPGSHPAQLRAWLRFTARSYGVAPHAWVAHAGGALRGILPLFEKRGALFSAPGGLLARDDDAAMALLAVARRLRDERGATQVELRDQRRAWPGLATSTEHCTHELALAADAATQWRGFDAKLRNQIRKAERGAYRVHWGADHVDAFHRVMLENMRDLGTPLRAAGWFRGLLAALGERAQLLVIERAGEPVGGMFLVEHRGWAMDIWASSLRRHFAHCPNQMLYWTALQAAIARRLQGFDFGRSQAGTGTYRFKAQWGAVAVPLYYQYLLPAGAAVPQFAAQRQRFDLAARLWQRLPLPLAGWLGEPIRRRFPELL